MPQKVTTPEDRLAELMRRACIATVTDGLLANVPLIRAMLMQIEALQKRVSELEGRRCGR